MSRTGGGPGTNQYAIRGHGAQRATTDRVVRFHDATRTSDPTMPDHVTLDDIRDANTRAHAAVDRMSVLLADLATAPRFPASRRQPLAYQQQRLTDARPAFEPGAAEGYDLIRDVYWAKDRQLPAAARTIAFEAHWGNQPPEVVELAALARALDYEAHHLRLHMESAPTWWARNPELATRIGLLSADAAVAVETLAAVESAFKNNALKDSHRHHRRPDGR